MTRAADTPRRRAALVLAIYGYQGLAAGLLGVALPNHFAALGLASAAQVGAHLALLGLPWALQPLWGPVVDRFGGSRLGRRRPWVLAAQAGALAALVPLLAGPAPGSLAALAPLVLAHGACACLLDTAADAWIIDRVPPGALGTVTALTRTGFAGGTAAGAAGFALLLPAVGVAGAAAALLAAGAALGSAPLLLREAAGNGTPPARGHAAAPGLRPLLAALGREAARPASLALLLFCAAQDFASAMFRVPLGVFLLQEEGWSAPALSAAQGALALGAGTLGALAVGWWTDRAGAARSLPLLLGAAAAAHALAAALLWAGLGAGPLALGLSTVTSALAFVALAPAVMRAAAGPVAASRFALYMAALNAGDVAGSAAGAPVAGLLGLAGTAALAGLVLLAGAVLARPMLRKLESARVQAGE
ncbi:MFS transporter [Roseococcus sp. DSY-14]|uniref:MFS transporter n=1 Tax=Roseococcus sp. DSY-14 TaxID=3369650 RepID=UPI00387B0C58